MSTYQTAVINGLLAENIGKNDLVRNADARARAAEFEKDDAEHEAEMAQIKLRKATDEIIALKNRNQELENLLSRPLKQIAQEHPEFKDNYEAVINAYKEAQDEILADWVLSQKAYKETAMLLGFQVGKAPEEVVKMADQQRDTVLNNQSEHGNNASTSPLLSRHAEAIIAMRKKNGWCLHQT